MSRVGIIYIIFFIITFIFSLFSTNDIIVISLIGQVFLGFGLFSLLENLKLEGRSIIKNPLILFFIIFIIVGMIMAFVPIIIDHKDIIENIFKMDLTQIAAFVLMIIFIFAGLLFFLEGLKGFKENNPIYYEKVIGKIIDTKEDDIIPFAVVEYTYEGIKREKEIANMLTSKKYKKDDNIDIYVNKKEPEKACTKLSDLSIFKRLMLMGSVIVIFILALMIFLIIMYK